MNGESKMMNDLS